MPKTGSSLTGLLVAGGSALIVGAMLVAFTLRRRVRPKH
jgi:LPXTG-motif cell wall-anchored protein